jgi:SAM-dependent methyltransferase
MTPDGEREIARTVVNRVAVARGLPAPWPESDAELPAWLAKADVSSWGVVELGEMRLRLAPKRQRDKHGMVYTPIEVVDFMVRSSMQAAGLGRLAGDPWALDHITIVDPACGPGIYLIHGARYVARWYATQLFGPDPDDRLVRAVLPTVMTECLYGIDLDPVAVDLARAVCWLEIDGSLPITFMDDNIAIGDTFLDEMPPKLDKRWDGEAA